jgi:hypothetical protein
VAAIASWATAFVLWDFSWAHGLASEGMAAFLDGISLHPRYASLSEGIVDVADLAYFVGLTLVGMAMARLSYDLRRVTG